MSDTCQLCGQNGVPDLREHLALEPDPHGDTAKRSMSHPTEYQRVWECPWCQTLFFHDDPLSEHMHFDCPNQPKDYDPYGGFVPVAALDKASLVWALRAIHGDVVPLPNRSTVEEYAEMIVRWYPTHSVEAS